MHHHPAFKGKDNTLRATLSGRTHLNRPLNWYSYEYVSRATGNSVYVSADMINTQI